jgi:NAD dependent epimerase/dehydratase family enzyme
MSWIHIQDLARLFVFALENPDMKGKYNAVAPNPVKNKKLTRDAAKAKGKAFLGLGVPEFVLKLILGEMAAMVLGGNHVSAEKTLETNFQFEFPSLDLTLKDLF